MTNLPGSDIVGDMKLHLAFILFTLFAALAVVGPLALNAIESLQTAGHALGN